MSVSVRSCSASLSRRADTSTYSVTHFLTYGYVVTPSLVVGRELFYTGSTRYDTTGNPQTPLPFSDDNAIATDKSAYIAGLGTGHVCQRDPATTRGSTASWSTCPRGGSHTAITLGNITQRFHVQGGQQQRAQHLGRRPRPADHRHGARRRRRQWFGPRRVDLAERLHQGEVAGSDSSTATARHRPGGQRRVLLRQRGGQFGRRRYGDLVRDHFGRRTGRSQQSQDPAQQHPDLRTSSTTTGMVWSARSIRSCRVTTPRPWVPPGTSTSLGGPFSPPPSGDSVASSGAAPRRERRGGFGLGQQLASSPSPSAPAIPAWIVNRLSHVDLNSGPVAKYLEHLAEEDTAKARAILVKADQVADALNLDDALLDSLLVKLGLE